MTILQGIFFFFFSDRGSSFELKFLLNVVDLNVDFHQLENVYYICLKMF